MGSVELWLGPSGSGKTGKALALLRDELAADWRGVRYLVPTVGHKRSIEQLLLHTDRQGLFGDPITPFFSFAEEGATRANLRGQLLTELQKFLLLRALVRDTPVEFFARARQFPGFAQALREAIDELKVQMVWPHTLREQADVVEARGAVVLAQKMREMGALYQAYQTRVHERSLYDSEGIMWTAAECLRANPRLFPELRLLILDGFSRLTPIQTAFLRALAPSVERIVVLFDYEEHGGEALYHPVQVSLNQLGQLAEDGIPVRRRIFRQTTAPRTALGHLRAGIFREAAHPCPTDNSINLFIAATPVHEMEMIARDLRGLLRAGKLPDGTRVAPADIAILARDARSVYARLERTFRQFDLTLQPEPPSLAHTPVGRALLAAFRLVRDSWQREDVLALLKSGYLTIMPETAFDIDLHARAHYLRAGKATWFEGWTDENTREALHAALAPLADFDDAYAHGTTLLEALTTLLAHFRTNAFPDVLPLPDENPEAAAGVVELEAVFSRTEKIIDDLQNLGSVLGGFRHDEVLDAVTTALVRETLPPPPLSREGIRLLSAHTTGGEKFKVVYLCNLVEGSFPLHQHESAFFLDHERDETLRDLNIRIDPKKSLEADEQYWFLHAISSATHRLVLSYAAHDASGGLLERSCFLDDVEAIIPDLPARARRSTFRQLVPSLDDAERLPEYLAGVAHGLRSETDTQAQATLAAAYAACPTGALGGLFHRALPREAALASQLPHPAPLSASELQTYRDCPFLWFSRYLLRVQEIVEEYSALDRGLVLHEALERLYLRHQRKPGEPVHLEGFTVEELWPEMEFDLLSHLEAEPRFRNRARFLQDIERESILRMMRRFLANEIERAGSRRLHPAYFERTFGYDAGNPVVLDDGTRLCGKIDRIDLADHDPGQAVVIDYKSSSTAITMRDMEQGNILQVPIYLLALRHLFGLNPLGAEFMGLKQSDAKGLFHQAAADLNPATRGVQTLDDAAWKALLDDSEARIRAFAQGMRSGHIPLEPTTPRCPDRCEYLAFCRGNRFELARAVRQNR